MVTNKGLSRMSFGKNRYKILFLIIFNILFAEYDLSALENSVKFNVSFDRQEYFVGENLKIKYSIEIDDGYHIYSVHPDKSLSPTYIEFYDSTLIDVIGLVDEPAPIKKCDSAFNQYVHIHKNKIQLIQNLKLNNNIPIGEYNIIGDLNYLACDATMCMPKTEQFNLKIMLKEGKSRSIYTYNIDSNYEQYDTESCEISSDLDEVINQGLFSFILFSLGMGFLALLTPCVFPMIPITVSFFTKEGEKENSNPIRSALIYALGIVIIFSTLGILLALTLGATGARDLAQNPWVNLFIASLFIYFAFSLFGFYEIQVPSFLRQFSLQNESKGGIAGILFMSLTFTLTSFTCTVQFVGLLLVAASAGEYFWPIVGMLSFSTAFAFPFFFLALFPQYLNKLPKSGGWLNSVKVVMGFLELAAAFKFISNSDLVWGWDIFNRFTVLFIWAIILFAIFIYIIGLLKMPHDSKIKKLSKLRIVHSIMFLSLSLYFSSGLTGNKLHGLVESYLPPSKVDNWIQSLDEALILSNEHNKPIFVDFTGYTCTNCRWMEVNIFEEQEVKSLFDNFILAKLYTDGNEKIHQINKDLEIDRFGTAALPFYVILSPGDKKINTFPGMDTNKNNFIKFLEESILMFKNNDY